jgi:hypothetical protein
MNTSFDLEARRKKIETLAKVAGLAVAGFLFAPFALATIQGLVSLLVVVCVGLLVVNIGIPWFSVTLANWRLKALKAAAAANPIETLENQYQIRQDALLKIRDNIKASYAVLQTLWNQIQEHNERFPNTPSQYLETYTKLKALIELRGKKYKQAQANLQQFGEVIEEKRSDWKIAQTMAEANKLANVGEDFQSKLLKDTALTTIQDGLNSAFADLDMSMLDEQDSSQATTVTAAPVAQTVSSQSKQLAAPTAPGTLDLGFNSDSIDAELVSSSPTKNTKSSRR